MPDRAGERRENGVRADWAPGKQRTAVPVQSYIISAQDTPEANKVESGAGYRQGMGVYGPEPGGT